MGQVVLLWGRGDQTVGRLLMLPFLMTVKSVSHHTPCSIPGSIYSTALGVPNNKKIYNTIEKTKKQNEKLLSGITRFNLLYSHARIPDNH